MVSTLNHKFSIHSLPKSEFLSININQFNSIKGEAGTLNIHRSGHVSLTLKDERIQIKGGFFGGAQQAKLLNITIGTKIECFGNLTVYETRGKYQFSIKVIRPTGLGDLQRKFEELKNRLGH